MGSSCSSSDPACNCRCSCDRDASRRALSFPSREDDKLASELHRLEFHATAAPTSLQSCNRLKDPLEEDYEDHDPDKPLFDLVVPNGTQKQGVGESDKVFASPRPPSLEQSQMPASLEAAGEKALPPAAIISAADATAPKECLPLPAAIKSAAEAAPLKECSPGTSPTFGSESGLHSKVTEMSGVSGSRISPDSPYAGQKETGLLSKSISKLGEFVSKISSKGSEEREKGKRHTLPKKISGGYKRLSRSGRRSQRTSSSGSSAGSPKNAKLIKSSNPNTPADYVWLEETLSTISGNRAHTLGVTDTATGKDFIPIFFVIGSCPNMFCGMQVVVYCADFAGEVDVWWVKPQQSSRKSGGIGSVEHKTLSRNSKGPYKNDPGRSKPFYKPLADLFQQGACKDGRRFGIEAGKAGQAPRAFIEESNGVNERWYMYLVWQEDWTTNPLARAKYIKGRVAYQKDREEYKYFTRQFEMQSNGQLILSEDEDQSFEAALPDETIKDLWE